MKIRILFCVAVTAIAHAGVALAGAGEVPIDFESQVDRLIERLSVPSLTSEECETTTNGAYQDLVGTPRARFDFEKVMREGVTPLIEKLFRARLVVKDLIRRFYDQGTLTTGCLRGGHDLTRAGRFVEDYLGEISNLARDKSPKLMGSSPHVLINQDQVAEFLPERDLQSGDILLSRGTSYSSASIARFGDVDGQFSHASLVYVDPQSGVAHTIEAHTEIGVVVRPYSKAHGKAESARELVLRPRDSDLARRAAAYAYYHALQAQNEGDVIPYDFEGNVESNEKLYCTEVIWDAFRHVSQSRVQLPTFPSQVPEGLDPLLARLGFESRILLAPSDLQYDPELDVIAEWRDFGRIHDTRAKDAVMVKVLEWAELQGYNFTDPRAAYLKTFAARTLRRVGLLKKYVPHPTALSEQGLRTFVQIESLGMVLKKELEKRDQQHRKQTGFSLTAPEQYQVLEEIRATDLALDRRGEKTLFHKYFRPMN